MLVVASATKLFPYREYALAAFAAKLLHEPVTWIADRSEHFLGVRPGPRQRYDGQTCAGWEASLPRARCRSRRRHGRLPSAPIRAYIPYLGAALVAGCLRYSCLSIRVRGVYTNTVPVDAYRGAGRPEAAYVIERLVDHAAREVGIAPDVLRRRNFIKPDAMPYQTATGQNYNSGNFAAHLARAQELADWSGFPRRLAQSKKAGRLRGIGLSTYVEACGNNGPETATTQLERDGSVTVRIGSQSTGQGHATAYAQLVAEHLGLPPERVNVVQGDTDRIATGVGTGGSETCNVRCCITAGRERSRRSGCYWLLSRSDECNYRCALALLPYFAPRHAGNAGAGLECDPRYPPGAGSMTR